MSFPPFKHVLQVHKDLLREATLTQTRLRQKDSCERTLAYELITHTFPAAIAGELFKYFQSIADDEVGPDDFPGPGYYARHSLRSPSPAGSPESPGSVRVSQSSTSVIGDYFSTFGGRHHRFTVIMFADLAGFTALATVKAAAKLVQYLDILFSHFDELCIGHKVEKIKTIGDCYMCVAWEADHESRPAATGSSIAVARQMHATIARRPLDGTPLQVRIGLHCGPVVGGIIGKTKFCYDIWGDTVNVASRMESTGQAGRTHVSADVCEVSLRPANRPSDRVVRARSRLPAACAAAGNRFDSRRRSLLQPLVTAFAATPETYLFRPCTP